MTVLVYQSNLWKLLEKVNVSITLALVPFHIGMVQKALKGTYNFGSQPLVAEILLLSWPWRFNGMSFLFSH